MTIYDAGPLAAGPLCGLLRILGACVATTKCPDNKKLRFEHFVVLWRFPRKTAFWDNFALCPNSQPPTSTTQNLFYLRLAVSETPPGSGTSRKNSRISQDPSIETQWKQTFDWGHELFNHHPSRGRPPPLPAISRSKESIFVFFFPSWPMSNLSCEANYPTEPETPKNSKQRKSNEKVTLLVDPKVKATKKWHFPCFCHFLVVFFVIFLLLSGRPPKSLFVTSSLLWIFERNWMNWLSWGPWPVVQQASF